MLLLCISHSGGEHSAACRLGPGGRGRLFERISSMEALWVAGLKLRRPTKHVLWEQTFENRNFQNFAKMWKIVRRTLGKILRKSQLSKFWKNVKNLRESLEGKKLILSKMGSGKCSYYVFPTVEGNILPPAASVLVAEGGFLSAFPVWRLCGSRGWS